jgi:5'-phosphate synthase pdxT subunit
VRSFEADLDLPGFEGGVRGVFIRAPRVSEHGAGVEVLAEVDGYPVAVRQGNILAVAFHPEIDGETRLHEWLLAQVAARNGGSTQ